MSIGTHYFYLFAIVTMIVTGFFVATNTLAQGQLEPEEGFGVNPSVLEQHLEVGDSIQTKITLYNYYAQDITISWEPRSAEVGVSGEGLRFLDFEQQTNSGLEDWITVGAQQILTIPAEQSLEIPVSITPPENSGEGSYYGGLLFTVSLNEESKIGTAVEHKVGSLFVIGYGSGLQRGMVTDFSLDKKIYGSSTVNFMTEFSNDGSTHLQPKGKIEVFNSFGSLRDIVFLNEDAKTVFPETKKTFIDAYKEKFMLGRYRARLNVWYGEPKIQVTKEEVFWVLPLQIILPFISGLVIFVVFMWALIKRYNHWIIQRGE